MLSKPDFHYTKMFATEGLAQFLLCGLRFISETGFTLHNYNCHRALGSPLYVIIEFAVGGRAALVSFSCSG